MILDEAFRQYWGQGPRLGIGESMQEAARAAFKAGWLARAAAGDPPYGACDHGINLEHHCTVCFRAAHERRTLFPAQGRDIA